MRKRAKSFVLLLQPLLLFFFFRMCICIVIPRCWARAMKNDGKMALVLEQLLMFCSYIKLSLLCALFLRVPSLPSARFFAAATLSSHFSAQEKKLFACSISRKLFTSRINVELHVICKWISLVVDSSRFLFFSVYRSVSFSLFTWLRCQIWQSVEVETGAMVRKLVSISSIWSLEFFMCFCCCCCCLPLCVWVYRALRARATWYQKRNNAIGRKIMQLFCHFCSCFSLLFESWFWLLQTVGKDAFPNGNHFCFVFP